MIDSVGVGIYQCMKLREISRRLIGEREEWNEAIAKAAAKAITEEENTVLIMSTGQ